MDNVLQRAGSSGIFSTFSEVKLLHVLPLLPSCCSWQAPRRLRAVPLEFDVKEKKAVCEQVLLHSILHHCYFKAASLWIKNIDSSGSLQVAGLEGRDAWPQ